MESNNDQSKLSKLIDSKQSKYETPNVPSVEYVLFAPSINMFGDLIMKYEIFKTKK